MKTGPTANQGAMETKPGTGVQAPARIPLQQLQRLDGQRMPFPRAHQLFTFHGSMPGSEQWTIGLRADAGPIDDGLLAAMANVARTNFNTFVDSMKTPPNLLWSQHVSFDGVTGRQVDTLGRTLAQQEVGPGNSNSGAIATRLPNQCATVVSLSSSFKAGRSGKGRVYLPLLALTMDGTGRHQSNAAISNAFGTCLDGINTGWRDLFNDDPISSVIGSQVGAGALSPITNIKVGDVVDTQRRRRAGLTESYSTRLIERG